MSPDGTLLAGSPAGGERVVLLDPGTGELVRELPGRRPE